MKKIEPTEMYSKVKALAEELSKRTGLGFHIEKVDSCEYTVVGIHPLTGIAFPESLATVFYNHNSKEYGWCSGRLYRRTKDIR